MDDSPRPTIPVSFDHSIEAQAVSADELALVAACLPDLLKEMLAEPENERE